MPDGSDTANTAVIGLFRIFWVQVSWVQAQTVKAPPPVLFIFWAPGTPTIPPLSRKQAFLPT
jgi:hypothetical protein